MNTKLQELTDKLYTEGVEKGKTEAAQIIENAQAEAAQIIEKATEEAESMKASARQAAEELTKNTQSELQLFAQQSVNALKTEITNLICDKLVVDSVKAATADKLFMQKIITELVQSWVKNEDITIETKDAQNLTDYFAANAKELLNKGLTIKDVKGLKTDFSIAPTKGGYKLTFGDDEFIAYFKEFLRPKLVKMLF